MQTSSPDLNARTYFLEQGQSITKLHETLYSSSIAGHLKRGLSVLIEVLLFLLFLIFILVAIYVPLDPIQFHRDFGESSSVYGGYHNDDITLFMILIKAVLFIASLMPLLLMLLFRRNRKKSALINTAFREVERMKEKFDSALKELPL